jgi:prophage regulatory protein
MSFNMAKHKSNPDIAPPIDDRIVPTGGVLEQVPVDRSTLWRMVQRGEFPPPIQITSARIGWRQSAIAAWLRQREEQPIEARSYYRRTKKQESA